MSPASPPPLSPRAFATGHPPPLSPHTLAIGLPPSTRVAPPTRSPAPLLRPRPESLLARRRRFTAALARRRCHSACSSSRWRRCLHGSSSGYFVHGRPSAGRAATTFELLCTPVLFALPCATAIAAPPPFSCVVAAVASPDLISLLTPHPYLSPPHPSVASSGPSLAAAVLPHCSRRPPSQRRLLLSLDSAAGLCTRCFAHCRSARNPLPRLPIAAAPADGNRASCRQPPRPAGAPVGPNTGKQKGEGAKCKYVATLDRHVSPSTRLEVIWT